MQMCLGLVAGPPKVKLFLNWFYCAHKYSMPISAVATGDSVGPTMCGHGPWSRDRCRFLNLAGERKDCSCRRYTDRGFRIEFELRRVLLKKGEAWLSLG
jgi:hypothetical protein